MHTMLAKGSWPGGYVATQDIPTKSRATLVEDEISQIVHDLKNPLAAIAMEATLLDALLGDENCVRGLRSVARIQDNVLYLDRIVHDLLDVCAYAAGELRMQTATVDICTLVERVIERTTGAAVDRIFVSAHGATVVDADENRIERVIANLLDNALRYSPESSRVLIEIDGSDSYVRVTVSNTGRAIPNAEMAQLFERYRRGSTAQSQHGSGLGLYTCKRIVEAHGGAIGADSTCHGGSRFFFDLPL